MGLPDAEIEPEDYSDYANDDRWIAGIGMNSSDDNDFGIIAIGALDLRSDGSFAMTIVYRMGLAQRWDSRVGTAVLERLLVDQPPIELTEVTFEPEGTMVVGGFQPYVLRVNARTLGDEAILSSLSDDETCKHFSEDPDDTSARISKLIATPLGTIIENCCGEFGRLPSDNLFNGRVVARRWFAPRDYT